MGVRPKKVPEALSFGILIHLALAVWLETRTLPKVIEVLLIEPDLYVRARATAMMIGYHTRWKDEELEVLAIERLFSSAQDGYMLDGKEDAIVKKTGRTLVMEHKTSSEDISPGSDYWRHLAIDDQISNYYDGAEALGFVPDGCLYDVLGKPAQKPKKATPIEKRQYTKKDGLLYKNQRAEDETPDEYQARILQDIAEHPDQYYQRGEIVRLEQERLMASRDRLAVVQQIQRGGYRPRTTGACRRYGYMCVYHDVCAGLTTLEDDRFRKTETKHEELA